MLPAADARGSEHDVQNLQFAPGNDVETICSPLPACLPVCLRFDGRDHRRSAIDISAEGMFVESPDHLPPGELVQVLIALPEGNPLRALATVERVVTPEEAVFCGGMPGMGLRFFMMDSRLRTRWEEYLEGVRSGITPNAADPLALEHRVEDPVKLSRRVAPRKEGKFRVRLASKEKLAEFYTRDVSKGGMFLATTKVRPIGTQLRLAIRHPVSGREFPMEAEVRWLKEDGPEAERGMGVQLVGRNLKREEAFLRFINAG